MINNKHKKLLIVLIARVSGVAISFLMNVIVTRGVSVNDAGIFFTSFSLVMLWGLIGTLGFCDTILRIRPQLMARKNHKQADSLVLFGLIVISLSSFIIAGCVSLFLHYEGTLTGSALYYLCACISAISVIQYTGYVFQAKGKSLLSVIIINISYPFVFSIVTLCLVLLNIKTTAEDLIQILFLSILSSLIFCMVLWKKYILTSSYVYLYLKRVNYKYVFITLLSFLLILICNTIIQWITPIISRLYVSNTDVALIAVCLRVGLVISFFLISLNVVFAPSFSRLYTEGRSAELTSMVRQSTRLMVLLSLPGIVLLIIFPGYILSIFGRGYAGAGLVLQIICIGQLINVLTGSVAFLLTMTGNEKLFRNIIIFNTVVMVINLNLLGKYFGIVGIATAVAISVILQNIIATYFVKRKLNINIIDYFYLK